MDNRLIETFEADVLGLHRDDAHISMFDLKQCLDVERHCRARFTKQLKKLKART